MTQKIEQSQRQERVAAWNRRAECDLAAFQNSPKQTYQAEKARDRKLCANLEEAIRRSGLQDGMTVSFHHAFRGGDLTVNMVMDVIAKMGFKNLTLASSSLSDCHAPLVEHIRQGVVTRFIPPACAVHWRKRSPVVCWQNRCKSTLTAVACIWYRAAN